MTKAAMIQDCAGTKRNLLAVILLNSVFLVSKSRLLEKYELMTKVYSLCALNLRESNEKYEENSEVILMNIQFILLQV